MLTACGSSSRHAPGASVPGHQPEAVRAAYLTYIGALASHDYGKACTYMSDAMRRGALHDAKLMKTNGGPNLPAGPVDDCPKAVAVAESVTDASSYATVKRLAKSSPISVSGE